MQLFETKIQDIDYNATKLITLLSGRGKKVDYDSLKGTEVFEFFRLLWVYDDLIEEEIKNRKKK